jgi:subtilisin-like proprotein convertase family protein
VLVHHRLPRLAIAALAALLVALATSSAASADTGTYSNKAGIFPKDAGPNQAGIDSKNYPSRISVGGLAGSITHVEVDLRSINATYPGDLDVLLVSPGGNAVVLMSDTGGTATLTGAGFSFSDDAAGALPDTGTPAPGTYLPTDGSDGGADSYRDPAPLGPYGSLTALDGSEPNGKWSLYVLDDHDGDYSAISSGWRLRLTTTGGTIVTNGAPLTGADRGIPGSAPGEASAYPSKVEVTGVARKLARVTVMLHDVAFDVPTDMDLLLVGPNGRAVVLSSDAGGGPSLNGENLSFDDAATAGPGIPEVGGAAYKPTDSDIGSTAWEPGDDVYPAPAPQGAYDSALSAFAGSDPNGEWALYMTDDEGGGDVNSIIGGWSLNITPSDTPVDPPAATDPGTPPVENPGTPPPTDVPATEPPSSPLVLSSLKLKPRAFTLRHGTTISYRLSRPARVRFSVKRVAKLRGTLSKAGVAGKNRLRFKGRIGKRALKPGSYRLVATPIDAAGKAGAPRSVGFRVKSQH